MMATASCPDKQVAQAQQTTDVNEMIQVITGGPVAVHSPQLELLMGL